MSNESNHWQDWARCRNEDPETMQPEVATPAQLAEAKAVCTGCPVIDACRTTAQAQGEPYGIWAGEWHGDLPSDPTVTACAWCGQPTGSTRAEYCGTAHRVAAHRARQAAAAGALSA